MTRRRSFVVVALCLIFIIGIAQARGENSPKIIELRAYGVPGSLAKDAIGMSDLKVVEAFQRHYPHIKLESPTGLVLAGSEATDMVPLMQIAGDIPPHVLYLNFRSTDTYIRNKLLYPLDKYIEEDTLGLKIANAPLLELDDYLQKLKESPKYKAEFEERVPYQCWLVMRRQCPYEEDCQFSKDWDVEPRKKHYHVWAFPQELQVMALFYRKDLFNEAGLPDRVPETMQEMLEWCRKLTDPENKRYGLQLRGGNYLGWSTLNFLYTLGGRLVDKDEDGNWRCVFDSDQAVEAYYFVARLFHEPFVNSEGKELTSIAHTDDISVVRDVEVGMFFWPIRKSFFVTKKFFDLYDPTQCGFGPVPLGPTGKRGGEFNARLFGIYAGLEGEENRDLRDAAWAYTRFFNGPEARRIRAEVFVKEGLGRFVQPKLLEEVGYPEYVRQIPKEWSTAFDEALESSIPEPYGKNCNMVYYYASHAVDQIRTDPDINAAIKAGNADKAKAIIKNILTNQVKIANEKMLNILPPKKRKFRTRVASVVAVLILLIFVFVFRKVFRTFDALQLEEAGQHKGRWQFGRFKWAYIILIPAVGSIALWAYYPLARGSLMAFQNYNIRGFVEWIGMENFANVLFDVEFWYSMWVSLKYAGLFMLFGFTAPIILAFLLTEVPRGKILFRTIYYLPAVLTGVVVIFLWKSFYGGYGMINQALNFFIGMLNLIPGVGFEEVHKVWLDSPTFALFFCLLPTIWAGMGPGCLIYLAALKTVPEESYEAADIDGAGILQKVRHVAIPGIKGLIMINFIGVMVGTIKGGSEFVLAMTGGGPYTPYGETEVVGLRIYYQAFGYLRFGPAVAMAWVLGSMLVGFTVLQLQRLSRMEFKTAAGVK